MKNFDRYLQKLRMTKVGPYLCAGARVLDIGCDDGRLFQLFPELSDGVGLDPGIPGGTWIRDNMLIRGMFPDDLPDNRPFDVITMIAVLEHVPTDAQATLAAEIFRHLKPGGILLITVPSPFVDHILVFLRAIGLVDADTLHQHYGYDVKRTPSLFGRAGFELIAQKVFQLGLNNFFAFQKPIDAVQVTGYDSSEAPTYQEAEVFDSNAVGVF